MTSLRHGVITSRDVVRPPTSRPPLRVGVALESLRVPRWIAEILSAIDAEDFLELDLLLVVPSATRRYRSHDALYLLYERLDRRAFRAELDALASVDISGRFPGATTIRAHRAGGGQRLDERAVAAARDEDLDVLLLFVATPPEGPISSTARFGAWRIRFGGTASTAASFGVREVYELTAGCEVVVEVVGESGGAVVDRSWTSTDPISLYRTRNRACWRAAHSMLARLRSLQRRGPGAIRPFNRTILEPTTTPAEAANRRMLRYVARLGTRMIDRQLRSRFFREQWFVAYRPRRSGIETGGPMDDFEVIRTPPGRSFMDPFVMSYSGIHYVFFEDYSERTRKGVISYVELDGDGKVSTPQLALERDYHLSYPFVFVRDGEIYMIPETSATGAVELYRATEFPHRWALDQVLIPDVVALDSTVVEHGGRVWLFASVRGRGTRISDELSLFWADSPFGPWKPHRKSPVVCDARSARPAGRMFERDGSLIRPSQDCSLSYGRAVVFNRVDILDEHDYCETPIGRIDNGWIEGNLGTHTYNFDAAYEVIDGRRLVARAMPRRRR